MEVGNWKIRDDRIGIPSRGDLNLTNGSWLDLKAYGADTFAPGGFSAMNLNATNNINNVVRTDRQYAIRSNRAQYIQDNDGDPHARYDTANPSGFTFAQL
jgi:hypothetical protein